MIEKRAVLREHLGDDVLLAACVPARASFRATQESHAGETVAYAAALERRVYFGN